MLKCKLMLAHLTEDGTDVKMDISWVQHLQAVVYAFFAKVKVVILNFKCFLEIA